MNTYFSVYRFVFICPLEPSLLSPRWLMISASGGSHSMGPFWQPTVKNTMRILQPQRFANPPSMGLPFFQSCSLSPEIATIKTLPCVANHGWMPEPPSLKQIQAACMNIPDFSHDGLLAATLASISTRFHDFPEVTFNLTSWLLRPSTDKHLWITSRLITSFHCRGKNILTLEVPLLCLMKHPRMYSTLVGLFRLSQIYFRLGSVSAGCKRRKFT